MTAASVDVVVHVFVDDLRILKRQLEAVPSLTADEARAAIVSLTAEYRRAQLVRR